MNITFTYAHPKAGPIQHNISEVIAETYGSNWISLRFKDDKGRELSIRTNQPYVFRQELDHVAAAVA